MKIIIDRFEGEFAVCELESGKTVNAPKELFPNIKEGSVIDISVDYNETEKRKENAQNRLSALFNRHKSN